MTESLMSKKHRHTRALAGGLGAQLHGRLRLDIFQKNEVEPALGAHFHRSLVETLAANVDLRSLGKLQDKPQPPLPLIVRTDLNCRDISRQNISLFRQTRIGQDLGHTLLH